MADKRISQFTPDAQRRIADAVRRVERSTLRETGQWADVPDPFSRVLRWGRTTTNYKYPTYPSSGGVYVVEMGEYQPDTLVPGDTPDKTFTAYSPAWTEIAVDPSGATIAEGTVVRVELHDGQWWIRPEAAAGAVDPDTILLTTSHWKTAGGATTLVPLDVAHQYFDGMTGDDAAIGVDVLCNSASVWNDPIADITEDGFYILDYWATCVVNYSGTFTKYTVTTSGASAGTAHTHTVDLYIPNAIWSRVQFTQRTGSSGAWAGSSSKWTTTCWKSRDWYDGGYIGRIYVRATHYINAEAGEQIGPIRWDVDGTAEGGVYCPLTLDTPSAMMTIRRVGGIAAYTNL